MIAMTMTLSSFVLAAFVYMTTYFQNDKQQFYTLDSCLRTAIYEGAYAITYIPPDTIFDRCYFVLAKSQQNHFLLPIIIILHLYRAISLTSQVMQRHTSIRILTLKTLQRN